MSLIRAIAAVLTCMVACHISQAQPRDAAFDKKLLQIASDAIEHSVWKGATPDATYAVIVDRGANWEIDYKYPPPRRPVVGYVLIDKKTMQVTRIYFNQ